MLFHTFSSKEEMGSYGGSGFVELQFCCMPFQTDIKNLVDIKNIQNWKDDSLYIISDDVEKFEQEYSCFFDCGVYNNLKSGAVDLFGVNYYKSDLIDGIIERLNKKKMTDSEVLIEWLDKAKSYNGFYILGI